MSCRAGDAGGSVSFMGWTEIATFPFPVETKKVMVRVEAELVTSLADTTL